MTTKKTSAFDYYLPPGAIAHLPLAERDQSRLLTLDRRCGEIRHRRFRELVDLIPPGDALVLNETKVLPARLQGRRSGGGAAEILLLRPLPVGSETPNPEADYPETWEAMVRPGSKLRPGRVITVGEDLSVEILEVQPTGTRIIRLETKVGVRRALDQYGELPLPPYIERRPDERDIERYQTVFAKTEGSVAAPTAGLHFTPAMLAQLEEKGVEIIRVLLHVGAGTFRPVEVEDPDEHEMHYEYYEVGEETAERLQEVRARGGKIWAVGTTVARTLETIANDDRSFRAEKGMTNLFIRPPYEFRGIDHLVTNFHLPRSTLLMLVAAFAGYESTIAAYEEAIEKDYRFYSYGDAMLITTTSE